MSSDIATCIDTRATSEFTVLTKTRELGLHVGPVHVQFPSHVLERDQTQGPVLAYIAFSVQRRYGSERTSPPPRDFACSIRSEWARYLHNGLPVLILNVLACNEISFSY